MIINSRKLVYISLILLLATSCSSLFSTKTFQKNPQLKIQFSNPSWNDISKEGSDFASRNTKTNSIIIVNSNCKKYISTGLRDLTENILMGLDNKKIIIQKTSNAKSREILTTIASGKLDGIQTYIKIITLKKNRCIYDYMLISKNLKLLKSDSIIFDSIFISSLIP